MSGSGRSPWESVCFGVGEYEAWFDFGGFLRSDQGVGHYDDDVSAVDFTRGGAVEAYYAGAFWAGDCVCVEAFAVVVVDDEYTFAGDDSGGVHEFGVDGYASDVVEVCLGDCYAVDF